MELQTRLVSLLLLESQHSYLCIYLLSKIFVTLSANKELLLLYLRGTSVKFSFNSQNNENHITINCIVVQARFFVPQLCVSKKHVQTKISDSCNF